MILKDADALKEDVLNLKELSPTPSWIKGAILTLIDTAPTVDAEIVVRCQNCKYHGECKYADIPGWFCADGERRGNDD